MPTPVTHPGSEYAKYIGAWALLHLGVFPSKVPGVYRCAIYEWFDRKPLYVSVTDISLNDSKSEAERAAAHLVGSRAGKPDGDDEWPDKER
jgi:hypothetical protein